MNNLAKLLKKSEKIIVDNSPAIMTGIGVAGLIGTAVLTGKATTKASRLLWIEKGEYPGAHEGRSMTRREEFEKVWKFYLPAVGTGALAIAAIIGSHQVGTRRAAAIATAYTISERAFDEYKSKVIEKIGETKETEIRDEIAKDRVNRKEANMLIVTDGSQVLCHDAFSNQFFMSDMETLRKAVNDINAQILHSDYATINDFYDFVGAEGLEHTSISGDMGWNTDKMLECDFSTILYKDKTPCISVDFAVVPIKDPWRFC